MPPDAPDLLVPAPTPKSSARAPKPHVRIIAGHSPASALSRATLPVAGSIRGPATVSGNTLKGIGRPHDRIFQQAGIECRGLWGSTVELERLTLTEAVASCSLVILVATPEAIVNNPSLITKIRAAGLGHVAFDEAHLFEAWRRWCPDLTLAASRMDCGRRLALSATVPVGKTSAVRAALYFEESLVVHGSLFLRLNLVIRVIHRDSAYGVAAPHASTTAVPTSSMPNALGTPFNWPFPAEKRAET